MYYILLAITTIFLTAGFSFEFLSFRKKTLPKESETIQAPIEQNKEENFENTDPDLDLEIEDTESNSIDDASDFNNEETDDYNMLESTTEEVDNINSDDTTQNDQSEMNNTTTNKVVSTQEETIINQKEEVEIKIVEQEKGIKNKSKTVKKTQNQKKISNA